MEFLDRFDAAISDDLNTPLALTAFEDALAAKKIDPAAKRAAIAEMDAVLGLDLLDLTRADLRLRPATAELDEDDIEDALDRRRDARAAKDFSRSDAIRDELVAQGIEVMDGDPLGWDWKL